MRAAVLDRTTLDRTTDVVDEVPESKADIGTAARMAADKVKPKFEELGANPIQAVALTEAFRLILSDDIERAKAELAKAKFTPTQIELIFPHLLSGLRPAA